MMVDDGEFRLSAVDAEMGELRWSHPASFELRAPGQSTSMATGDHEVFAMLASRDGPRLARVDAAMGTVAWSVPLPVAVSEVRWCDDRICAGTAEGEVIVDPMDGSVLDELDWPVGRTSTVLSSSTDGSALIATEESLQFVAASGVVAWEVPYGEVFGGSPVNWEYGHRAWALSSGGWVVYLGDGTPDSEVEQLAVGATVGLGHVAVVDGDGAVQGRWPDRFRCLPVELPVFCTGRLVRTGPDEFVRQADGASGFPSSGGDPWTATLPTPVDLDADRSVGVVEDDLFAFAQAGGAVTLEATSGRLEESGIVAGWCLEPFVLDEIVMWDDRGEWARAEQYRPCGVGGEGGQLLGRPSTMPEIVGAAEGDRWIWATDGQLRSTR
jgi:outer membrane protein assembly factor BamB